MVETIYSSLLPRILCCEFSAEGTLDSYQVLSNCPAALMYINMSVAIDFVGSGIKCLSAYYSLTIYPIAQNEEWSYST